MRTGRSGRGVVALAVGAMFLTACDTGSASAPDGGGWFGNANAGASLVGDDGRMVSIIPDLTAVADLGLAPSDEQHTSYAPQTPAPIVRPRQAIVEVHLEVVEGVCPLDPANDVTVLMWGFRVAGDTDVTCGAPGPVVRVRVGDVLRMTVTNLAGNEHPHNIDFHAVTGQGGGAEATTVGPGESATIDARILYPGAFMYHCAFGDVPEHIGKGMYGMVIVDPEVPLPRADHEWAVMQSEWYVGAPDADGFAAFDREAATAEEPRYLTFNGRTDALTGANALQMQVGERARIHMVNEGLNLASNFHPIGGQWDAVWVEGATHQANSPIRGSQSTLVVAGGGTVVDLVGYVPSTILLVDHALVRTFYKGLVGQVVISGEEAPEIFAGAARSADDDHGAPDAPAATDGTSITIPAQAFDPANADQAYSPRSLTVTAGTTVTWTNEDIVPHTVTSGTSDGTVASPDGTFDTGNIAVGGTSSITFEEPGTFSYYCTPHPWMQGEIVVEPA